jgi:hypothetical protein
MLVLMMFAAVLSLIPESLRPAPLPPALHIGWRSPPPPPGLLHPPRPEAPDAVRLYCLDEAVPGDHAIRRTCRTRDDWAALGFVPVAVR